MANSCSITRGVWKGLVPLRVELLSWSMLIGRLNTKDRLCSLNWMQMDHIKCVPFRMHDASIQHLFLNCDFSWNLWSHWLRMWNVNWLPPCDQRSFFESWMAVKITGYRRKLQMTSFFLAVWTIWKCRMKLSLTKKEVSKEEPIQMTTFWFEQFTRSVPRKESARDKNLQ